MGMGVYKFRPYPKILGSSGENLLAKLFPPVLKNGTVPQVSLSMVVRDHFQSVNNFATAPAPFVCDVQGLVPFSKISTL